MSRRTGWRPPDARQAFTRPEPARGAAPGEVPLGTSEADAIQGWLQDGVEQLSRANLNEATACFERVIRTSPRHAVAWNCLGIVARAEHRVEDAIRLFQQALRYRPDFPEAHNNLGNALRDAGRDREAGQCYRQALLLKPHFAEARNNLGVVLLARGETSAAIRELEAALELQPDYAEAHNNLANALREQGDWLNALARFQIALSAKPDSAEIHNNLANVLRELGHLDEAQRHYEQAVTRDPRCAQALENLGSVLMDLHRADAAVAVYEEAVRLRPSAVGPLVGLGNACRLIGESEAARAAYGRVQSLEPARWEHRLLSAALCPPLFRSRQEMDDFRAKALAGWDALAEEARRSGGWSLSGQLVEPSFNWQFLHGNLRPLRESYARIFGPTLLGPPPLPRPGRPRIGVVVTHGHEGLFLRSFRGIIERLDASEFEVAMVCPRASEPRLRQSLAREVTVLPLPTTLPQAAEAIRQAGFRALYFWEIGTDAMNYFLPFARLAPVQCTSWGIQVTSGIPEVDYYLSSALVEPSDAAEHYSEQLVLASTLLTYQFRPQCVGSSVTRESLGASSGEHLYVCAQQPGKFHPDFDAQLGAILSRDPRGVLVVAGDRYGRVTKLLRDRLAATIPDVDARCRFLPRLDYPDYLRVLQLADAVLDPPHFGGVNSSYDAFAVGQPVIACPSPYHRGRYTAACYRKMGLPDAIAATPEDFVNRAVAVASEPDLRESLRAQIREASGELFEDREAVREHERIFRELVSQGP